MSVSQILSLARVMNAAHRVVYAVLRWLGLLFGLIPKSGQFSPTVYRCIHYGFIIAVTLVLAWYSPRLISEGKITVLERVPILHPFVQRFYVAIQFVLFYLFVRLLIVGIELFLARDLSEFEDIDSAWEAGLESLAREGFDVQWLPVFLVNGATPEQQKSLFESARLQWKVNCGGDDARSSALSFHACDEALFICLNDVGAMSRQLKKPALARGGGGAAAVSPSGAVAQATLRPGQIQAAVEQTRRPDQLQAAIGKTLAPGAVAAAVGGATVSVPQARFGGTLLPGEIAAAGAAAAPPAARPAMLDKLSQDELQLNRRRLEYLCQRLVTERGSYCPLNGLLQVIPLRWSQSAAHEPLFAAAGHDLQTLHDGLHLQFPVVCLHAGLEDMTGLPQFIERGKELDARFRDSRAGSRFPAGLPIDEKSSGWVIEKGLQWFRDWVYAEFAKNLASPQNRQLYQFLCALSIRRDRLARELRTIAGELRLQLPVRLTGCYFTATGAEPTRQAFVHGVMQRLMSEQNDVAWMPEWRSRDRRLLWLTLFISLMTFGILGVDVYLVWRIWERAYLVTIG